jgi:hypothetical protein
MAGGPTSKRKVVEDSDNKIPAKKVAKKKLQEKGPFNRSASFIVSFFHKLLSRIVTGRIYQPQILTL